jgi:hypothetical protein
MAHTASRPVSRIKSQNNGLRSTTSEYAIPSVLWTATSSTALRRLHATNSPFDLDQNAANEKYAEPNEHPVNTPMHDTTPTMATTASPLRKQGTLPRAPSLEAAWWERRKLERRTRALRRAKREKEKRTTGTMTLQKSRNRWGLEVPRGMVVWAASEKVWNSGEPLRALLRRAQSLWRNRVREGDSIFFFFCSCSHQSFIDFANVSLSTSALTSKGALPVTLFCGRVFSMRAGMSFSV